MQTFLNAITRYVRDKFTNTCTWGHLDDLMFAHHDATYLPFIHILHIFSELHYLFKLKNLVAFWLFSTITTTTTTMGDLWRHTCAYFVSTLVHFTFHFMSLGQTFDWSDIFHSLSCFSSIFDERSWEMIRVDRNSHKTVVWCDAREFTLWILFQHWNKHSHQIKQIGHWQECVFTVKPNSRVVSLVWFHGENRSP